MHYGGGRGGGPPGGHVGGPGPGAGGKKKKGKGRGGPPAPGGPSGANAEPQKDYYSVGGDPYADYLPAGASEQMEEASSSDAVMKSPPREPRAMRIEDSYRPATHSLPPRPDVRAPGASPQQARPPPSSPPQPLPTPSRPPAPAPINLMSSSPVARFHLDSDMIFEPASEADHHDAGHGGQATEGERKHAGYTYSPSSPLPDFAPSTSDAVSLSLDTPPANSALGLTTDAGSSRPAEADKNATNQAPPPPEKDSQVAPKPFKVKPVNRNVRKNEPPRPPQAEPKGKEKEAAVSSTPPRPAPGAVNNTNALAGPGPSTAASSAAASTAPAPSTTATKSTSASTSASSVPPPRNRTPEPTMVRSSPLVASAPLAGPGPLSPEDVKPNLELLCPSSAPAPTPQTPREGVLALRRADLPLDCFSTDRILRVPARHIVAQNAKAQVVAEGKIVLGTRWRDDGFCVDWQLPVRSESDDDDDGDVEFVAAPPRPPPEVVDLLSSSEDEAPLARNSDHTPAKTKKKSKKNKGKNKSKEELPAATPTPIRPTSAQPTTPAQRTTATLPVTPALSTTVTLPTMATHLSPSRSPALQTLARVPDSSSQRAVDSSTLPQESETPSSTTVPLPPVESDQPDIEAWAAYVAGNPVGSVVFPFPEKYKSTKMRGTRGYIKWRERRVALFRTYFAKVASNEVTCAETDGSDGSAPGLRVNWTAFSDEKVEAAVEERRATKAAKLAAKKEAKRAQKEAERAQKEAEQQAAREAARAAKLARSQAKADQRAAERARRAEEDAARVAEWRRAREAEAEQAKSASAVATPSVDPTVSRNATPQPGSATERQAEPERTTPGWVAVATENQADNANAQSAVARIEERDELDEENKPDVTKAVPRSVSREVSAAVTPEEEYLNTAPGSPAKKQKTLAPPPRPSAPPAASSQSAAPISAPVARPAASTPAPSIGRVPSPPPSPPTPSEVSQKDAELTRLRGEISTALERLARWQRLQDEVPGQSDVVSAQIDKITNEVFSLQEQLEQVRNS